MSMFQNSVLKSFSQDEALVAVRFAQYQKYKEKIDFIKGVKEEKYQEGFLKDIFENCLGYTLDSTNPNDFNLEREKKNETDSKKADGVIYLDDKVVGIIELKGQNTKNLDKVQQQAFWYLTQHSNAKYVIISNFDELRFYFDKSTSYEKFSLFNLDYEDFKKLHLLLSFESIKDKTPLKLKEKTANFEAEISKELYKDFSAFRNHLFENIVKNNSDIEKSILLRLTQKLCDRIIFILFAEDRGLLSANTIKEIREEFNNQKFTDYKLYDIYKFYFNAINEGNSKLDIPKYNGGLFANDTTLDNLIIDNDILDIEAQKLSDYDFLSEVSVNILGHIFEQSLTDLEEIQSNIDNTDFDKTKTKRKKDGVFYTPPYITKYIVDNTLGKMCIEKREELHIGSETLVSPKNLKKLTKKEQQTKDNLETYKNWLFNLKILDPACGSGAFLNQALEFLIREHTNLQNDLALMGDLFASYTVEESVLENNLYGVDINEDATEIAKLSLWLRTAKKGRPLTKLADKILCANSLLDMPFEEGSFDIVIGNPPYVRSEIFSDLKPNLQLIYKTFVGTADLFVYFYELGIKMLKPNGLKGYICSSKFFRAKYGEKLREYILTNTSIEQIVDFEGIKIFEDAMVESAITIFKKNFIENHIFKLIDTNLIDFSEIEQPTLNKNAFSFIGKNEFDLKIKIENNGLLLKKWDIKIFRGLQTGNNKVFIISNKLKEELIKNDINAKQIIFPIALGKEINPYALNITQNNIIYINDTIDLTKYTSIKDYLELHKKDLDKKKEVKEGKMNWYSLYRPAKGHFNEFLKEKLIWNFVTDKLQFSYIEKELLLLNSSFMMTGKNLKYILSILNSKVSNYYIKFVSSPPNIGAKAYVEQIPIPEIATEKQQPFINLVDNILTSKETIKKYKKHFDSLNAIEKIEIKEEIEKLENSIEQSINEIDSMVYKLYGLSDEEIKIVEGV
ncbi:MAG: N-6 DNA methylase [Campylobacterota bacterium]|nr:N-6 DNA methylase [Campylobacterota bacterium]